MRTLILILVSFQLFGQNHHERYFDQVKSEDAIIQTLYEVISGDAGEKRDWDLFTYLFAEKAQLIPIQKGQDGTVSPRHMTPSEYVETAGGYLEKNGFHEVEIDRTTESFGHVTHVFSTYASYRKKSDTQPFARGINSIQLMNDQNRWWILNIAWDSERPDNPIPSKYLNK